MSSRPSSHITGRAGNTHFASKRLEEAAELKNDMVQRLCVARVGMRDVQREMILLGSVLRARRDGRAADERGSDNAPEQAPPTLSPPTLPAPATPAELPPAPPAVPPHPTTQSSRPISAIPRRSSASTLLLSSSNAQAGPSRSVASTITIGGRGRRRIRSASDDEEEEEVVRIRRSMPNLRGGVGSRAGTGGDISEED